MAGCFLVIMGITGLGAAVKFIPRPVTIGFTNGIALLIASTQIKDFLGLKTPPMPSDFLARLHVLGEHLGTVDIVTAIVALASLAVILLVPRFSKRIPGSIVALVLATVATELFHLPIATIGSKFGGIPLGLPHFAVPPFRPDLILPLLPSAITVAMLAAIESLLSAVVADGMSGDKHNSNMELVAQGLANLAVPFVGGIPATGAIARTATNIRSGAKTPVAGIVHALTLLLILLVAAPLYIYRVSSTTTVSTVTADYIKNGQPHILQDKQMPSYVTILRIHGPFLFGATEKLLDETRNISEFGPVVILRLRNMNALDATGLHALEALSDRLRTAGKTLLLCGARDQPAKLLEQGDFIGHVGKANILPHVDAALARAREIYEGFDGVGEDVAREELIFRSTRY